VRGLPDPTAMTTFALDAPSSNNEAAIIHLGTRTTVIANGGFADSTSWSEGISWTIADGKATCDVSAGSILSQAVLVSGEDYFVVFDMVTYVAGKVVVVLGGNQLNSIGATGVGLYAFWGQSNGTGFEFQDSIAGNAAIDNAEVYDLDEDVNSDGSRYVIEGIEWSYDGDPSSGDPGGIDAALYILGPGGAVWTHTIEAAGPGQVDFSNTGERLGFFGAPNKALSVVLTNVTAAKGKLNVRYR